MTNEGFTEEDLEDGPASLIFIHAGHTGDVQDFYWSLSEEFMFVSVAN